MRVVGGLAWGASTARMYWVTQSRVRVSEWEGGKSTCRGEEGGSAHGEEKAKSRREKEGL